MTAVVDLQAPEALNKVHMDVGDGNVTNLADELHDGDLDGNDSDSDSEQPSQLQTERRQQAAVFKAWMISQASTPIRPVNEHKDKRNPEKEQLSISQIMQQQESEQIIDDPRDYQLELFERAKIENTIAVLDTGTGKTLIAVLLLRHILDQELEDRLAGKPHKIAFFLVPAVNLVFQQQAVLKSNLDYEVNRLYGAMGIDLWTREEWVKIFNKSKVLVCTPEVLYVCLSHGFVRMDQINLLIFDEAHHAKRQHPYSKIMRDYFDPLDATIQPRVFGMTASPVDAKAEDMEVIDLAKELESTLHSKIATTSRLAPLTRYVHRPQENKQMYDFLPNPSQTLFCADILSKYGHFPVLRRLTDKAAAIHAHLGSWCADRFWHIALPEKIAQKSDMHLEKYAQRYDGPVDANRKDSELGQLRELLTFIKARHLPEPLPTMVSAKTKALRFCLEDFFSGPSDYRCIVFVTERHTARLLSDLFIALNYPHLRCSSLIGVGTMDMANPSSTLREQVLTLKKFRQGEINCLFATSVAEEGLDVPSCNLIVRFDLCRTMIQYVQSRGRARHRNSTFIHMVETGNKSHLQMLDDNQRSEQLMRSFCSRLPEDRQLVGNEDFVNMGITSYQVPSTGAKLTSNNAVVFLAHFISTLPNYGDEPLRPQYVVEPVYGGFICEVVLPTCSPIRGTRGKVKSRKVLAKCSAAYHTCILLLQNELLDDNLLPVYKDRLPTMRNAALALTLTGKTEYEMRHKPQVWDHGKLPDALYGSTVHFHPGLDQPHRPFLLLSRKPLDAVPSFEIFFNSGAKPAVVMSPLQGRSIVSQEELDLLTKLTIAIFRDLFNKTYEHNPASLSYWLAPVSTIACGSDISVTEAVDWNVVRESGLDGDIRWSSEMPADQLLNKFLVDPFHGGKRFFTKSFARDLRALDPNPDHLDKGDSAPSIIQTSVSLWRKSKLKAEWDVDQPVLIADKVLHRRNMLAEVAEKEKETKAECYVCPQPLRISRLPAELVASCYALPAVIWRLESHMIAEEAFRNLNQTATPSLALEALTKDSDATGDYGEDLTKVKVQRGMGRNYERLEFLGDTFLKMATTIATYIRNPHDNELDFHVKRMLQLCNQNLLDVALDKLIYEYIRTQSFSRRTWYPEGLKLLEGKGINATGNDVLKQKLGKKTIADVSEAIIGAVWLSHNIPGRWTAESWNEAVRAVTTLTQRSDPSQAKDHTMTTWSGYADAYIIPEWQLGAPRAYELHLTSLISTLHPYTFRKPRLLHAAFTHPSMPTAYESVRSYQQLEFLGDALLDMACVSHLIYRFPDADPQWLTEHKSAMVANRFLGALCVRLGFHSSLRHNTNRLGQEILRYKEELEEAERVGEGAMDYWTGVSDPPKALADVIEAYVGAVFLDSGFDYGEVQKFFDMHMLPFFENMEIYDTFANDHPIVRLHKLLQQTLGCRGYRVFAEEEPPVDSGPRRAFAAVVVHGRVVGGDVSWSLRYGKARSAGNALRELVGLGVSAFRAAYGCDCRAAEGEGEVDVGMEDAGLVSGQ